ncbi:MAG: GNAT family N-acetyltransferase [Chloroflexota bacterium]|nr:GNAT family N-acetyltransferase [Chloroflexota bacterium]MDE2682748.1 GNAT family N-acetyltransferase [Chloroflexota bacterium]
MRITELAAASSYAKEQAAALLVEGFAEHWPDAWPNLDAARLTVRESLSPGRIARAALDGADGKLLGWAAAEPLYHGNVWELTVLVVRPSQQRQGIGRALVSDMEERVREQGGLTIWLGSDDEDAMTSLAGVDLYPDPLAHLAGIRNYKGHPYEFYRKMGFAIAGVLPDANGLGKPDIFLAKSVARR